MAYSELIKNYERIRGYMRQFYVYGFKSREEYRTKSARSYDNERRRVESWLGDYMCFRQDAHGKSVFLSVDSRRLRGNPLYKSFKAKSFTAKDITLHFYLLDILANGELLTLREIMERLDGRYLTQFDAGFPLDESTVRKKLKEYESAGLLAAERRGREVCYRRQEDMVDLPSWLDAVSFFSEENPLGVIGSYLLDKFDQTPSYFGFKHHYILHALDSQVICDLLMLIRAHRAAELTVQSPRAKAPARCTACPLKLYISTQTGRQYLLAYRYLERKLAFTRLDTIHQVEAGAYEPEYEALLSHYQKFKGHCWGVSTGTGRQLEHLEMTVRVNPGEGYILRRLEREKRGGRVERLDAHTCRFCADIYDASELQPWLRTFTGRIVQLSCSRQSVVDTFFADLARMQELYGGGGGAV